MKNMFENMLFILGDDTQFMPYTNQNFTTL